MALDKQMILSELGSVMNKLQSADCGCMGKLFSNQGQNSNQGGAAMGSQLPTCGGCRRGCGHGHGYGSNQGNGTPCAGEPYSMNKPHMGMQCNPPQLYADTYNYLNSNLMKPIVQEVYQDLKSINPSNSVVNNPMASQMGLQQQGQEVGMIGNVGMTPNQMPGNEMGGMHDTNMSMNQQMGGQQMGDQQMSYQQMGAQQMGNQQLMSNHPMSQMGGMGPNIVNMMNGDGRTSGKTGQQTAPMVTGAPEGQVLDSRMGHAQYNAEMSSNLSNYGGQQQTQSQYMQQPNMSNDSQNAIVGHTQQNPGQPGASYKVNYSNPAAQQMSANRAKPNYGQHTPGIAKFNEMFPGVMGGDLGFDPMSIAIQMNPANQQQAAMGQMQKLMNGSPMERTMQPATTGANMASATINQQPASQQNIPPSNLQPMQNQPGTTQQNLHGYTNAANTPSQGQQQVYGQVPQVQQHQVYTAVAGSQPTQQYQQPPPQQYEQHAPQQYQQLNVTDPNTHQYQQQLQYMDPNAQTTNMYERTDGDSTQNQQPPQSYSASPTSEPDHQMMKEPIFPVDTSKNQSPNMKYQRHYEYNTLGQPVEMLPAKLYHPAPDTNMQQTLSPQPILKMRNDQSRFIVKNTVSKTSLMGSRPVGRTPSRGQLQQIYNQYKGSHSYTQQNIRPSVQGGTFSEGKINIALANANQHRHVPVERVGGDTMANNQAASNQMPVKGQPMGHAGDVPVPAYNKPHGDIVPTTDIPTKRTRNGLQDMVYTSYPTSAAWSFHGNKDRPPYAPGARYHLRRA